MNASSVKNFFYRMLCGAFLGISVIAPGISGSIMAVMMGMYNDLINVISNPFKNFKKNFFFLLPMGIGAVISMVALIKVLSFLFENYTVPAYLLFMSLILGSIPTVVSEVTKDKKSVKPAYFVGTAIAFAFALTIGLLAKSGTVIPIDTTDVLSTSMRIYVPICTFVAGMMSMLPGMSISMLLMMFSIYEPLLGLASGMMSREAMFTSEWFTGVLAVGTAVVTFLVGMVLFSNITKLVMDKYHSLGFLMVLGFMFGSIISIFPGLPSDALDWLLSVAAVIVSVSISLLFRFLGKKFNVEQ